MPRKEPVPGGRRIARIVAVALAATPLFAASAPLSDQAAVERQVRRMLDDVVRLARPTSDAVARKDRIHALLRENIALGAVAQDAVGPFWPRMTPAQRRRYLALLSRMVVRQTGAALLRRGLVRYQLLESRRTGDGVWMVATRLTDRRERSRLIHWRLRPQRQDYRVVDMVVDGTSVARTRRSEFTAVLQRSGGDIGAFLARLEARSGTGSERTED